MSDVIAKFRKIKILWLKIILHFGCTSTVIIVRVPSIEIPVFFAWHRPERDRHRINVDKSSFYPWCTFIRFSGCSNVMFIMSVQNVSPFSAFQVPIARNTESSKIPTKLKSNLGNNNFWKFSIIYQLNVPNIIRTHL